jgi:hypothetical protein
MLSSNAKKKIASRTKKKKPVIAMNYLKPLGRPSVTITAPAPLTFSSKINHF